LERVLLRAIMDISAPAISLADILVRARECSLSGC
jgi:hypothetical protein